MLFSQRKDRAYQNLIARSFAEDAPNGDITSKYFSNKNIVTATMIAKESGIIAGIAIAQDCFTYQSAKIKMVPHIHDGISVKKGTIIATITGPCQDILQAERPALNFLQHLSGIATITNAFVKKLPPHVTLLDTRKTIPGLRHLEKYAVTCGGGKNHRMDLSSMILVKDNHLAPLTNNELRTKIDYIRKKNPMLPIEIEAETLEQVAFFTTLPINIIMLDNMSTTMMKKAVTLRNKNNPQIKLEVSGNVTLNYIQQRVVPGINFVSVGCITHSVAALDISLRIKK